MTLLKWVWADDTGNVSPSVIYFVLRAMMFILSFVLEDWAIYELVQSPRQRSRAVLLVASSYVTWTFQTHTFSNSIETLLVAWSLVLIQRIAESQVSKSLALEDMPNLLMMPNTANVILSICASSLAGRLWHFQPHHIPCVSHDTQLAIATTLLAQVSIPHRP